MPWRQAKQPVRNALRPARRKAAEVSFETNAVARFITRLHLQAGPASQSLELARVRGNWA